MSGRMGLPALALMLAATCIASVAAAAELELVEFAGDSAAFRRADTLLMVKRGAPIPGFDAVLRDIRAESVAIEFAADAGRPGAIQLLRRGGHVVAPDPARLQTPSEPLPVLHSTRVAGPARADGSAPPARER